MWPALMVAARTYAPFVVFPFAFIIGAIGYSIEGISTLSYQTTRSKVYFSYHIIKIELIEITFLANFQALLKFMFSKKATKIDEIYIGQK